MMPALFIAHGSPMNALGGNSYAEYLAKLGSEMTKPRGILMISAHWETRGSEVLELESPPTIHDFFGFPPELYSLRYPAPGAPWLAARVAELLEGRAKPTKEWGFDHGTWAVLLHLYPQADVPVSVLSLDRRLSMREHFELGRRLRPLRDEGILIVGSGNIVHNLRDFSWNVNTPPYPWAVEFDTRIASAIESNDLNALLDFQDLNPTLVKRSIPTPEHYAPLAYILAVRDGSDEVHIPFAEMQNGSIDMRSIQFGKSR